MANYTYQQLENIWIQNGGSASTAPTAAAVALAESSGNATAFNPNDPHGGSVGLWQINEVHGDQASTDINTNAAAAVAISNNGTNWNAWGAYTNGSYLKYYNPSIQPNGETVTNGSGSGSVPGSSTLATPALVTPTASTAEEVQGQQYSSDFVNSVENFGLQVDNNRLSVKPWYKDKTLLTGNPRIRSSVQPVSFTIYLDQQQPSVMLTNPTTNKPIEVQLNCSLSDFTVDMKHIINRTPSRTGMHVTYWGMAADTINGKGSTGVFLNQIGLTDWFSTTSTSVGMSNNKAALMLTTLLQKSSPNITTPLRVAAQDAFVEFLKLFQMNGVVWFTSDSYTGYTTGENQLSPNAWSQKAGASTFQQGARNNDVKARGYVAMKIRNNVYLGYFKSLSWTQDASKPFHWNFEFTFQVEKTVVSMYYPQGGSTTTSTTPAFNGEVTATIIPTSTTPTPTTPTPTPTPPKPAPVDTSGS